MDELTKMMMAKEANGDYERPIPPPDRPFVGRAEIDRKEAASPALRRILLAALVVVLGLAAWWWFR